MKLGDPQVLKRLAPYAVMLLFVLIVASVLFPVFARGREKARTGIPFFGMAKSAEPPPPMMPPQGEMMQRSPGGAPGMDSESAAEAPAAAGMPGPGAMGGRPPGGMPGGGPQPGSRASASAPALNKNGYYSSTYLGGEGDRDRLAKLIREGVVVGGKTVKLAAFTRQYSQAFSIPTREALSVSADLEQGKLPPQGGEVHLQIGLQAIKREAARRPPVNLVLVIDRSGSMGDENKLSYARKAAVDIIDGLAATDRLAIVAYDDTVQVAFPSSRLISKPAAKRAVEGLTPGGSTNIFEALQTGYAQARKGFSPDGVNQVLLLSDGIVTAGMDDPFAFRELASKNADADIQTSTVGMGMEFDETIMMDVAQVGRGGYHFISDLSQTREIFQKELGRLTRAVAKAVKVRIVLPQGVELVRVLGSSALSEAEAKATKRTEENIDRKVYDQLGITADRSKPDEPGIKMLIPHFYAGDSHVVMLKVRVPRGTKTREIARVEVKYKDLVFKANREVTRAATVTYTPDKAAVVASVKRPVKKNVLGFQTGEALLKAGEFIKQGRHSDAARAIDEHMVLLGVAAREWRDKDLDRDGELLDQYKYVIANVGSGSLADSDLGSYLAKSMSYSGYELTR